MGKYSVGIDLGTTNSVVSKTILDGGEVETFSLPQLVGPGELARSLDKLPSAFYLPSADEFGAEDMELPWGLPDAFAGKSSTYFLGAFASAQGAKVPGRQIVSAKSWLSHSAVDRRSEILPWGGLEDVPRMSPVEASARILAHIRQSWDAAHPEDPLAEQDIILTVPASFDEVARTLTVEAAKTAGLDKVYLLEEPQAAFYSFLQMHQHNLMEALGDTRLILVVDVGGGTTDLTLVQLTREENGPPRLERIAVGEHLMLGGDNMDATLGRFVEKELTGSVGSLSAARWGQLVQASRVAKETLLSDSPPAQYGVALVGRGKSLLGGSQSYDLAPEKARELILDGFFPLTASDDMPRSAQRSGLMQLGLPYETDVSIPRHIASFLKRHAAAVVELGVPVHGELPRPDAIILNGGVFQSGQIRQRLGQILSGWFDGQPVPMWTSQKDEKRSLFQAVSHGAAYYGLVRRGLGVRIGSGTPRPYFVGVQDENNKNKAMCIVPKGMYEGAEYEVDKTFQARLGRPVSFQLFSGAPHLKTRVGETVDIDSDLSLMAPVQTVLNGPSEVPVRMHTHVTEVGTLEVSLHMMAEALSTWKLDFSTRVEGDVQQGSGHEAQNSQVLPAKMDEAKTQIENYFGKKSKGVDAKGVKNLRRKLEKILGPRDQWSLAANREMCGLLLSHVKRRRRTPDHERIFFQLVGYTLRPGYGAVLDDWRIGEVWSLFSEGVQYVKEKPNWAAYWLMWRRVSAGLGAKEQEELFDRFAFFLAPKSMRSGAAPVGPPPEGHDEMVRLAACLERLPVEKKVDLGGWILHMLKHQALPSWWALGRLGARVLGRSSLQSVVPVGQAEDWLEALFQEKWLEADHAAFAAAQIARKTDMREIDVSDETRKTVLRRLEAARVPGAWIQMVKETVEMDSREEAAMWGDNLPAGLKMV
jgi:hypothetical protein